MLVFIASVLVGFVVILAGILCSVFLDRNMTKVELEATNDERRRLQHMLQQHTETIDANAADMEGMRSKISAHAEEIMQLRVANEDLERERGELLVKLADAGAAFDRIDSVRIGAMQRLTFKE